jgi:hypothetical protein
MRERSCRNCKKLFIVKPYSTGVCEPCLREDRKEREERKRIKRSQGIHGIQHIKCAGTCGLMVFEHADNMCKRCYEEKEADSGSETEEEETEEEEEKIITINLQPTRILL